VPIVFDYVSENGDKCGFANEAYHVCEKENDKGDGEKDGKEDAKEEAKETQYIYGKEACCLHEQAACYGVATISRLLKIIGLFCIRALQKR